VTPVDRERQRVYDAEDAAFGGTLLHEHLAWDDMVVAFHAVVGGAWWRSLGVTVPALVRARADSARSSSDGASIRIAPAGQTALTVAHELAHHLVAALSPPERPAHGPEFRAAALRTVAVLGGTWARGALDAEWERWGVPAGAWAWAEPPAGPGHLLRGAIAL
jgi:hypothetical protein